MAQPATAPVGPGWPSGLVAVSVSRAFWQRGSEWWAKLVITVHAASFLIGKGGKRIKLLQEDSGTRMQLRQGSDAPRGLGPDDRVLEIYGGAEELEDGLDVVLRELDRIPEALAPRTVRLLVPEALGRDCVAEARAAGAEAGEPEAALLVGEDRALEIDGDVETRLRAATSVTAMLARRLWRPGVLPDTPLPRPEAGSTPPTPQGRVPAAPASAPTESAPAPTSPAVPAAEPAVPVTSARLAPAVHAAAPASAVPAVEPTVQVASVRPAPAVHAAAPASDLQTLASTPHMAEAAKEAGRLIELRLPRPEGQDEPCEGQDEPDLPAELQLALPRGCVHGQLIPWGYFTDIAQICGVAISVCGDVAPGLCQIRLTGAISANALAVMYLQCALAQCQAVLALRDARPNLRGRVPPAGFVWHTEL